MPSITWTACLSDGIMLREAEGAWVHVVLLELAVAMVTAADVEGVVVVVAALLSPGLCLSISRSLAGSVMGKLRGDENRHSLTGSG